MSGERPSAGQEVASRAQSRADRTGKGKKQASRMQSRADRAAYPKHGQ
jgi:hypothetical protein